MPERPELTERQKEVLVGIVLPQKRSGAAIRMTKPPLTPSQSRVWSFIRNFQGDLHIKTIASKFAMTMHNAEKLVDALERKGYITTEIAEAEKDTWADKFLRTRGRNPTSSEIKHR
jgi:hypothetical protein